MNAKYRSCKPLVKSQQIIFLEQKIALTVTWLALQQSCKVYILPQRGQSLAEVIQGKRFISSAKVRRT
jgi:hypothetical protein